MVLEIGFNAEQEEALMILFEQYWVLRKKDPESYRVIRENEKALKRYISEKFGYAFIIHKDFIKLEKVPVEPKTWMGLQDFQEPRDYALFCCGLAYMENRSIEDQFLLSELTEALTELFPGLFSLDWTNYQHRLSLVRVIKKLVELDILQEIDSDTGGVEGFARTDNQEVLFQSTIYSRYFMRTHARSLKETQSIEEILKMDWERDQEDQRRKRVYRQLLLEPVLYRESEEDLLFDYIRRFRNRVREDIETHTPYELQITKNMAMLTLPEQKQQLESFPDRKAVSSVSLHFLTMIQEKLDHREVDPFGEIRLTQAQFEQMIQEMRKKYQHGWSSEYREKSTLQKIAEDVFRQLDEWSFLKKEEQTGLIVLRPAMSQMIGQYPADFAKSVEEES
ncbi:TIGR02678 family protein [Marinilactibacillus psychrotolerans]|uniref:TIGR02678 family protein n=1 Tax=Marinilactibacillus psychrotolerans TaxID=191770 RepID=UPI00388ADEC7